VYKALEHSRVGRAWLAIREDEDAAELMGVPTFKFKLWAFAIGAGVGGLAGSLYASQVGFINPDNFPFLTSILFLAAVVLGGSGNIPGVIVGAAAISYLPERLRNCADKRVFVFGVALILVMVFRPQGLLPKRQRAAELTHTVGDPTLPGTAGTAMVDAGEYTEVPDGSEAPEVPEDDLV
jgi:branched-chain amino acid transport system permease protein